MSKAHLAYLSLGSNIEPGANLIRAVELLQNHGRLEKISTVWESESAGAAGPNYLNACVALATSLGQRELKEEALFPIETKLGRQRSADKFAPRTIDIDIVVFDERSGDTRYWEQAFVVIPLAEIHPEFHNPLNGESIWKTAERLRRGVWMQPRPEILKGFNGRRTA